ncbi:MAG: tRNA pseudouridine(38-40) synthase TruA [Eubacteriales bacterium]
MRIKLVIEYDGTAYSGWQRQEKDSSVQQTIEEALETLTREKIVLHSAGRTDAGVHALGQTAHFDSNSSIPAEKYSFALNSILPPDIRIRESCEAEAGFHARFDAKVKHYRYVIHNDPHASATRRNLTMHVPLALDIEKMRQGAAFLVGEHDFAAFTTGKVTVKSTVRRVFGVEINRQGSQVCIDVYGSGFLYNMVRIIAGTLIYVGIGKLQANDVKTILESRDRRRAGITARPQGLYLVEVRYDEKKLLDSGF